MSKSIYSPEYQAFLEVLRSVRMERGLTQTQLATLLGVTQSFVSKCERGERRLDLVELRAWCKALDCPLPNLLVRLERSLSEAGLN